VSILGKWRKLKKKATESPFFLPQISFSDLGDNSILEKKYEMSCGREKKDRCEKKCPKIQSTIPQEVSPKEKYQWE